VNTVLGIASARALPFLQMGWGGDHMDGWGWGGWLAMSLGMVLFWGTIALLGFWAFRSGAGHSHQVVTGPAPASALDIARERYARGEISDEEFQRIRRGLS
jgi:putative membrane protein